MNFATSENYIHPSWFLRVHSVKKSWKYDLVDRITNLFLTETLFILLIFHYQELPVGTKNFLHLGVSDSEVVRKYNNGNCDYEYKLKIYKSFATDVELNWATTTSVEYVKGIFKRISNEVIERGEI